nr:ABC transporter substrate-binding protein [Armatimonadota bacterium]
ALSEDPKTLDPSVSYTVSDQEVLMNICETFLQYHYLKRDPFQLVPSLGARMPTRQPYIFTEQAPVKDKDGKPVLDKQGKPVKQPTVQHGEVWTFTVKPHIFYADNPCFPGGKGREVLASDFVYSFKRMADPKVNCPILNYLLPHVIGLQEFNDNEVKLASSSKKAGQRHTADLSVPVSGVRVDPKDPYTFHITLRDPYPQLQNLMAMSFTTPIPHEAVEYYDGGPHGQFRQHPVGAGPYYLAEWREKARLVLKRNPNYNFERYPTEGQPGDKEKGLLADAGKPLPFADEIVMTIIKEGIPGWNLFLQGYMDSWGVPKEAFDKVVTRGGLSEDMKARGISLSTSPALETSYLGFNMEDSVVGGYTEKKRKLRQAISLAFNSPEYIELTANGRGIPAQGLLPPGIFGYEAGYKNPYCQTNLTRAKQLLAEAGYPDGIDPSTGHPLEIHYVDTATSPEDRQANGLVIRQLERLNIHIVEQESLYSVFQDRVNNGQYQLMPYGWVADYPDPENFYLLFYTANKSPDGANSCRYSNPEFDRLYRQMAAMENSPARLKIIQQMRGILQEDCPWVYKDHPLGYSLRYNWVKNAQSHPVATNVVKYHRIDYKLRARKRAEWNRPAYGIVDAVFGLLFLASLPAIVSRRRQKSLSARAVRQTLVSRRGTGGQQQ